MMISAVLFLVAATPICLFAAWSDLKYMIIPNWVALALVAAFCLLGVMFLPFEDVLWRLLAGFLVLVSGFVLNALGLIGGGDVKFLSGLVIHANLPSCRSVQSNMRLCLRTYL